jgi:hypothetical protein
MLDIIGRRKQNQALVRPWARDPAEVVAWFGAVQAQDYLGALWAVGLRTLNAVESDVELAIAERRIVRTWPMRGTLHFVAADDVHWLQDLLAPRIIQLHASRLAREFELDATALTLCRKIVVKALEGQAPRTRIELYAVLNENGMSVAGQRGVHILGRLAQEGLICGGPRAGKQPTFVLLDEWVPEMRGLLREEALAELALRYFTSHGPATVRDLSWWSGLNLAESREAVGLVERRLLSETVDGERYWFVDAERRTRSKALLISHLLPPFDEYLVGYQDRTAVLNPKHAGRLQALLSPAVEVDGKIVGTWSRRRTRGRVLLQLMPFTRLPAASRTAIARAAERYAAFLGVTATMGDSRSR